MIVYSSAELLALRAPAQYCTWECSNSVLKDTSYYLKCQYAVRKCIFSRKRGKKAGFRQKLRHRGQRLALPTVIFGNTRSIKNKIDELASCVAHIAEYRNSCVIVLTETWLDEQVPDTCVSLNNFTLVREDR